MVNKPQAYFGEEESIADTEANPAAATETRVAEALARAGDLDASNVSVTTIGAQVVLRGTVAFPEEIAIAGDIASRVSGVVSVENLLATATQETTMRSPLEP